MFDNLEDGQEAWHACRSGWCAGQVGHMSVSFINHQLTALFSYGLGFILAPSTPFVCGYTADGGTQGRTMGGCYDHMACSSSHWWGCAWTPNQLSDAISTQMRVNAGGCAPPLARPLTLTLTLCTLSDYTAHIVLPLAPPVVCVPIASQTMNTW